MYMYINFVFLLWGSKLKYSGNLLLTASSWKIAITAIVYMQYHCKKMQKNTGKEVKTTMQELWLYSFGIQSFVLH